MTASEIFCFEENEWLCSYEYLPFQLEHDQNIILYLAKSAAAEAYKSIVIFEVIVLSLLYENALLPVCLISIKTFF